MHQGLAAFQAIGAQLSRTAFLALLAESYGKSGQAEEGLGVLAEALAAADKTGERLYEAEIHRLKGELTLRLNAGGRTPQTGPNSRTPNPRAVAQEAEAYFLKAIEVAREQQAKSLELRATISLSRLWRQQRRMADAWALLSETYGWFTEGFDTVDLKEAKSLLQELAQEAPH